MESQITIRLVFGSMFLSLVATGIVSVVLPLYLNNLGIALVGMGFIFSLGPIVGMIIKSVVAVHSDVVGRRGYFSFTFLIRSIVYGFYSVCKIHVGFAILRTLDSFSIHLREAVEMPLVVDVAPKEKLGRITGIYWSIFSIASAVGTFVSGVILLFIGYFWLFLMCSLLSFIGLTLSFIVQIPIPKTRNIHFDLKKTFNFKELDWNLKVLFLSSFIMSFGFGMVESFAFPLFLQRDLNANATLIGVAIGLGWMCGGIPVIVWSKMTDEHSPVRLYSVGMGLVGFLIALMSIAPDLLSTVSLYIISGFAWGFAVPAEIKVMADSARSTDRARDMNLSRLGSGIGMMVGSIGSGVIAQTYGFRPLFVIAGALYLTCAAIFLFAIRGYK